MLNRVPERRRAMIGPAAIAAGILAAWIIGGRPAAAETPTLEFDKDGPAKLRWNGTDLHGELPFAVERIILEDFDPKRKKDWGFAYGEAKVDQPKVEVDAARKRIVHSHPWGRATLELETADNRVGMTLEIENQLEDRAIADFTVRLLDFAMFKPAPGMRSGMAQMTLDRPFWYSLPVEGGRMLVTCETFDAPLQLGFGADRGGHPTDRRDRRGHRYAMKVWGGAPAMEGGGPTMPLMGLPRIKAGQTLTLKFNLRFAKTNQSDSAVLRPYLDGYREAQGEGHGWTDRRPIARVEIPSEPGSITLMNPRGWFGEPGMDVRTDEGRAAFEEKLMALADEMVQRMKATDSQGMVVWNIEGSHVPPAQPMGEPRLLSEIAPEMDELADTFFKRFRDAGFRTGLTIRPSQLVYSDRRQRWTQGTGALAPDPDPFAERYEKLVPDGLSRERVYPLAERLSDKIAYAKERWGCSLFYVHFNGLWVEPEPGQHLEWIVASGKMLEKVRAKHPDVLLIPQYAHRHWRSGHSGQVVKASRQKPSTIVEELGKHDVGDLVLPPLYPRISFRGTGESRLGGTPTPEWVVVDSMRLSRTRYSIQRILPAGRHVLRQSLWASGAPHVDLKLERLIREYVLTLEQHMEYSREEARRKAEEEIIFETTPTRVREWMPSAFTTIDLTRAEIEPRRSQLERATAWGDVLMWSIDESPELINALAGAAESKKRRLTRLAEHLGVAAGDEKGPLPLSLVWAEGEAVDPEPFVSGAVPEGMWARVAYGKDRRSALLMLAWRDGVGEPVELRGDLPGLGLASPHTRVWQYPTGGTAGPGEPFLVNPDPVAGLSMILVEGVESRPERAPAGVVMAASFNDGAEPTIGGGPVEARKLGDAKLGDGSAGKGLKVSGDSSAAYGVVPDWFGGTVEFDVQARDVGGGSLRLLKLTRHADVELRMARQGGRVGLVLRTSEPLTTAGDEAGEAGDAPANKTRQAFAAFGPSRSAWRHVVLTWEFGQYRLFVDGKLAASVLGPTRLQRRDGTVFEPGLMLGGEGDGATVVDELVVYDWPFEVEHAEGRTSTGPMKPLGRKANALVNAWVWGSVPKKVHVGISARGVKGWHEVEKFRVRLLRPEDAGQRQLAVAEVPAYGGVGLGGLTYRESKDLEFPKGGGGGAGGGAALDGGADDFGDEFGELGEELGLAQQYILEITPLPEGSGPPARKITFEAGGDEEATRW